MDQERKKLFMQDLQKKLNLRNQKPANSASNENNENAHPRLNAPRSFGDSNFQSSIPFLHGLNKEQDDTDTNSKEIDAMGCKNNKVLIGRCPLMKDVGTKTLTRGCIHTVCELIPNENESNQLIGNMPILREQSNEELEEETTNSIVATAKLPHFGKDTVEYIDDKGAISGFKPIKNYSNFRSLGHKEKPVLRRSKAQNLHYSDNDSDKDIDTSYSSIPMDSYEEINEKTRKLCLTDVTYVQEKKPSGIGMVFASMPIEKQDLGSSPIPDSVRNGTYGQESSVLRFKFDTPSPDDIVLSNRRERGIPRR